MNVEVKLIVVALFATSATLNPFLSLFLQDKGFDPTDTGMLVSFSRMLALFATPVICSIADHYACHRILLTLLAAFAAGVMSALMFVPQGSFALTALLLGVYATFSGSKMVITDTIVLRSLKTDVGHTATPIRELGDAPSAQVDVAPLRDHADPLRHDGGADADALATAQLTVLIGSSTPLTVQESSDSTATVAEADGSRVGVRSEPPLCEGGESSTTAAATRPAQSTSASGAEKYPLQRLWGSISYGIVAFTAGIGVKAWSRDRPYVVIPAMHAVCLMAFAVVLGLSYVRHTRVARQADHTASGGRCHRSSIVSSNAAPASGWVPFRQTRPASVQPGNLASGTQNTLQRRLLGSQCASGPPSSYASVNECHDQGSERRGLSSLVRPKIRLDLLHRESSVWRSLRVYWMLLTDGRILGPIVLGVSFLSLSENVATIFLFPYVRHYLNGTPEILSTLLLVHLVSEVVAFILGSRSLAVLGKKWMLVASALAFSYKMFAYSFLQEAWMLLVVEMVHGLCAAYMWTASIAHVSTCVEKLDHALRAEGNPKSTAMPVATALHATRTCSYGGGEKHRPGVAAENSGSIMETAEAVPTKLTMLDASSLLSTMTVSGPSGCARHESIQADCVGVDLAGPSSVRGSHVHSAGRPATVKLVKLAGALEVPQGYSLHRRDEPCPDAAVADDSEEAATGGVLSMALGVLWFFVVGLPSVVGGLLPLLLPQSPKPTGEMERRMFRILGFLCGGVACAFIVYGRLGLLR